VIYSAIDSGFFFMTFVAIVVSVISAAYYLRLIKESYSQKQTDSNLSSELNNNTKSQHNNMSLNINVQTEYKEFSVLSSFITFLDYILKIENNNVEFKVLNLSNVHAFIISVLTFTIILFFLNTSILMNSASLITLNYFYL
jgi:NADH-ubiquinone oxidoreductase chain 2